MKKINLLTLLVSLSVSLSAQQNNCNGYVITNKGDSIPGYFSIRSLYDYPKRLRFRPYGNKKIVSYWPPTQIARFGLFANEEVYESARVTIDAHPIHEQGLASYEKDMYVSEDIFMKLLVRGRLSLYRTHFINTLKLLIINLKILFMK
ncbi:hypothetical protein J2T02_002628 [Chitinophaga terrae (ex Kim and Jung 2007)]|uniref:hypothetical protein n=1 Tax=Chitinophaga terrae (ex Kim and Jung 2007) TaxID=408074 RepID=UPI002789C47C|nr:hypothetical protein [Chitinophaga terrae (ex Kim and Jung 2007)]MDQ0107509.1 hypothetical protein [Chitinophaga terrae (ex Kim and Jung 2007)]